MNSSHIGNEPAPRIAISACLLGQAVRYDGGHKRHPWVAGTLAPMLDTHPLCPEAGADLGIPREPMGLVGDPGAPRLLAVNTRRDRTAPVAAWLGRHLPPLLAAGVDGAVLKARSPSCGVNRVPLAATPGGPTRPQGQGLLAAALCRHLPPALVVEESALEAPLPREAFIRGLFLHRRWRLLLTGPADDAALAAFHRRHTLTLMAFGPRRLASLRRLAAGHGSPLAPRLAAYGAGLHTLLAHGLTRPRQVNALQHAAGYLKNALDPGDNGELHEAIAAYGAGELPLLAPITLINHHARRLGVDDLARQHWLHPAPGEMALLWGG